MIAVALLSGEAKEVIASKSNNIIDKKAPSFNQYFALIIAIPLL